MFWLAPKSFSLCCIDFLGFMIPKSPVSLNMLTCTHLALTVFIQVYSLDCTYNIFFLPLLFSLAF